MKVLFNAAQFSISSGIAGFVYIYSGGVLGNTNFIKFIIPAALCALSYCLINSFLVTIGITISSGMSITRVYKINIKEVSPTFTGILPLFTIITNAFSKIPKVIHLKPARFIFLKAANNNNR